MNLKKPAQSVQRPGAGDVEEFLGRIKREGTAGLFAAGRPLVIARAPGRLDVMGGIADYSGSLVLQWPIREATLVAVQQAAEPGLSLVSRAANANEAPRRARPGRSRSGRLGGGKL